MSKLPSVYKRPGSPVYWGSVMIKGKRKQYALVENKAASQRMLAEIKEGKKELTKYGNITWSAFKEKFLEWARANKSKKTVARDILTMEYLEEFKPNLKALTDITPRVLEDFKTWLINRTEKIKPKGRKKYAKARGNMGPDGVNRTLSSAKAFMRKAEDWDLIAQQKWRIIKKIKTAKGRIHFFTPEELGILVDYTTRMGEGRPLNRRPPWLTVTLLGGRAGLRRAETHHARRDWIDLRRRIISVMPEKDWHPKDYECRDIPLTDDLYEHLKELLAAPSNGPYLVYDQYGDRMSLDSYTAYYGKIVRKCSLKGNTHTLRHTFASHGVQNGIDLYTMSKMLGHSSIKTTEIYAHLSPITYANAIQKMPIIPTNKCSKKCSKKISK